MNVRANVPQISGIPSNITRAGFNQQLAQAHASADPRYNMKPLDRAGFSRGGAQNAMAGISAAQNLAEGVAKAYAGQLQDAQINADLGNQSANENAGLALNAIAQQQAYANAMAALQRQNLLGGLLGGNLNSFLGF